MATIAIAAAVIVVGLVHLADRLGPQLGDIVAFLPRRLPSVSTASITVSPTNAPARKTCVLDVQAIQKSGGSLVIEATHPNPDDTFVVHWAGLRTSDSQQDCGSSADFVLNRVQVAALIFAAGGKGVKAAQDQP
jgi:hypothetical protein